VAQVFVDGGESRMEEVSTVCPFRCGCTVRVFEFELLEHRGMFDKVERDDGKHDLVRGINVSGFGEGVMLNSARKHVLRPLDRYCCLEHTSRLSRRRNPSGVSSPSPIPRWFVPERWWSVPPPGLTTKAELIYRHKVKRFSAPSLTPVVPALLRQSRDISETL
jgi:hypothetical protein